MIDSARQVIDEWKNGDSYDMLAEYNKITFIVITIILFGNDVNQKIGMLDYIQSDDSVVKLHFSDFFIKLVKELSAAGSNPLNLFAPILNTYDVVNPFKRNKKNVVALHSRLREYLASSQDTTSVYYKLTKIDGLDGDQVFTDLIGFLFAGHETSSHGITSALYLLAKNPHIKSKLLKELNEFKGLKIDELKVKLNKSKIDELEYLHLVVKETLRLDPPVSETLLYSCSKDFELCGVAIKKGQMVAPHILSRHLDPIQWKDPLKFIPERFDSESEFFLTPETNEKRSLYSFIPFSYGIRSCPGQTLAILEIKVMLVYFLLNVEYEIDKDILENPYAYFGIISQLKCIFKPHKI